MLHETAPELYPQMVELGTVTSLLGLLTHENTDISISAITVLQDLTDADVILEREEVCVYVSYVRSYSCSWSAFLQEFEYTVV
jgi:Catenin-beta-like, Arm-motif containing nuclear